MRVCVYGAGAIGGHLAARLAQGGAEVSVVARGPTLAAIRDNGLRVTTPAGVITALVQASDNPAELGAQDAVIVCVKSPALPEVAAGIAPLLRADTPVVFALNGIQWWSADGLPELDPDQALHRAVGVARSLGGVVYSACSVTAPGEVLVGSPRNRIVIGAPDGTISPQVEALASVLRAGGIGVDLTGDIRTEIWRKLLINLGTAPLAVITGLAVGDNLREPAVAAAMRAVYAEVTAIAQSLGSQPTLDVEAEIVRARGSAHKPSMLQDFERGSALEIATLLDAPLSLARQRGVPTPMLDLLVALVKLRMLAVRG